MLVVKLYGKNKINMREFYEVINEYRRYYLYTSIFYIRNSWYFKKTNNMIDIDLLEEDIRHCEEVIVKGGECEECNKRA